MTNEENLYDIVELANKEWKNFALYTVESRAIPNMIDALKPVQRFYLYSSIINSKKNFEKVSAVSGVVSKYGYNHGETSCAGAGQLMAADWYNNVVIIESEGSFGSRLVQEAGAPRYTFTRLHENFYKYYTDFNLAPAHADPEHLPPAFYVPIIPMVLINGAKGIATGFATNILPRDEKQVAKACSEYIKTGKIKTNPAIKYPQFNGTAEFGEDGRLYITGVINRKNKTEFTVTEVPYGYDREKYVEILNKLEDDGVIMSYVDKCDKSGFRFDVKLKQANSGWDDARIIKEMKLQTTETENITVINHEGKLKVYTDVKELIKDFCEYKKTILQLRIDTNMSEISEEMRWKKVKMYFIMAVIDEKIKFKGQTKAQVADQVMKNVKGVLDTDIDNLLRTNILSLTSEMVSDLASEIVKSSEKLKYWKETTVEDQYLDDLKGL